MRQRHIGVLERRTCALKARTLEPGTTRPVKAILCTRFGTADDLVLTDIAEPVAGPGEVVTRVKAVGLNFYDTLIIAGRYQKQPPFPFSPGGEYAGVVESVGAGVSGFAAGDHIIGYVTYGAARDRMAAPADKLIKFEGDLEFDRAAALTIIYGTAMHGLRDRAQLKRGETLAVLGAAGGVGLAAVELGKHMGARVIACASTDEKCAFARAHGADETVNYTTEDLRDALKRLGGERGIDVIFDPVGDRYSEPALRAIAWAGRHLVVGFAAGEIPKLPLNLTLLKGCAVVGVYFGDWVRREPTIYRDTIVELARLAADGKLSCHVDHAYPLAEFPQALKSLTERRAMGKVIVRP
jgi:NADPH2:quinone reductase